MSRFFKRLPWDPELGPETLHGVIRLWQRKLLVRQTPAVHRHVWRLLHALATATIAAPTSSHYRAITSPTR